jgi:hypothetical protein
VEVPAGSHDRGNEVTFRVSQTQAEAAVMQQTAAKFEQVDQSLQTMLSGLMAELEALQQAWRGAGGRSFEQVEAAVGAGPGRLTPGPAGDRLGDPHRRCPVRRLGQRGRQRVSGTNRSIQLPL